MKRLKSRLFNKVRDLYQRRAVTQRGLLKAAYKRASKEHDVDRTQCVSLEGGKFPLVKTKITDCGDSVIFISRKSPVGGRSVVQGPGRRDGSVEIHMVFLGAGISTNINEKSEGFT